MIKNIIIAIKSMFDSKGLSEAQMAMKRLGMTQAQLTAATKDMGASTTDARRSIYEASRKMEMGLGGLQQKMKKSGIEIMNSKKYAGMWRDQMTGAILTTDQAIKRMSARTMRFKMHLLSIMFFGMFLKRIFEGFLKSAVQLYTKVAENQTVVAKQLNQIRAGMAYFKFAIIDALEPLIKWISELVIKFADWISMHPEATKWIGVLMILGAVIGSILFLVGTLGLGFNGMGMAANAAAAGSKAAFSGLSPVLLGILGIFALVTAYMIISWKQVKLAGEAAAKGVKEGFKGNMQKSFDYFDISTQAMMLSFEKFTYTIIQKAAIAGTALKAVLANFKYYFTSRILGAITDLVASWVDKLANRISFLSPKLARNLRNMANGIRGFKSEISSAAQEASKLEQAVLMQTGGKIFNWASEGIKSVDEQTKKLETLQKAIDTGYLTGETENQSIQVAVSSLKEATELYDKLGIVKDLQLAKPFVEATPAIESVASAIDGVTSSQERLNQAIAESKDVSNIAGLYSQPNSITSNATFNNTFNIVSEADQEKVKEWVLNQLEESWNLSMKRSGYIGGYGQ